MSIEIRFECDCNLYEMNSVVTFVYLYGNSVILIDYLINPSSCDVCFVLIMWYFVHYVLNTICEPIEAGCISLLVHRLDKLPSQIYSNGPDNFGNLGSKKEIQPQMVC